MALLLAGPAVGTAAADTGPSVFPFTVCPPVGVVMGCGVVVTLNANGTTAIAQNPNSDGVYDGSDDTLIGVVNNSGHPLSALPLTSSTAAFGFESDGPCTVTPPPASGCNAADTTGYGGPGVTYSNISADTMSGTVDFSPAVANGGSSWFGLEDTLTSSTLSVPSAVAITADTATVAPSVSDGYTVTVSNTSAAAFDLSTIVDTLPAGFTYTGPTTGGITAAPTIAGAMLTWTGPFTVPANGTLQFHFNVTVSSTPGSYTDSVTGNTTATLTPATATATIMVGTVVGAPAVPVEGLPIALLLGGGAFLLLRRRRMRPGAARD
jgi:hypothetical protein